MTSITISCSTFEELVTLSEGLRGVAIAQNQKTYTETILFLIEFYKTFNRLLLAGECSAEAKQFIKDQAGWTEPLQLSPESLESLQIIRETYGWQNYDQAIALLTLLYQQVLETYTSSFPES